METMKLYKFVNSQYGLWDLRERKIKISRLEELNDPSELRAIRSSLPDFKQALEDDRIEFSNKYGLLCFCEDWRSPVLWAHYAENHIGLCLGFEVYNDDLSENKIKYEKEPIVDPPYFEKLIATSNEQIQRKSDYTDKSTSPEDFVIREREAIAQIEAENLKSVESDKEGICLMTKNLLTKHIDWSYEKEYRFFPILKTTEKINNKYFYDFTSDTNNIKLVEVIIGLKSKISLNIVNDALGVSFEYVKIFKVGLHDEEFEMDRTQWK